MLIWSVGSVGVGLGLCALFAVCALALRGPETRLQRMALCGLCVCVCVCLIVMGARGSVPRLRTSINGRDSNGAGAPCKEHIILQNNHLCCVNCDVTCLGKLVCMRPVGLTEVYVGRRREKLQKTPVD